eukprot:CAMPEP_0168305172 /NCGR_PEP_ID=MMETSP0142_2-20121227/49523_1 /TAXON_ID=44445 /ORGANISM="Pseudo-nitzschia australis, Strain 10249 10 AB" /LENGTH=39 /DNA_ID= /DNA_START= /DNA_END= /DNA_ORIENTATION=
MTSKAAINVAPKAAVVKKAAPNAAAAAVAQIAPALPALV